MGNMERQLLVNTTLTTSTHHPENLWKSPRGTVLRIQALAVAAIIITFFLIVFGSCRRWSSRWIVQKGFFAAQVLSLSLGTYSIGLMQSSSVKSEMYPIWTVSLFTIFGCIDPVTSYNGLDYKGQLSKVIYGICLQCGYVMLMSISAVSGVVGNTAIGMLSAITLIKGFHRSLALVQQRRMRNMVEELEADNYMGQASVLTYDFSTAPERRDKSRSLGRPEMVVDFPTATGDRDHYYVCLNQVDKLLREKKDELHSCYDACTAYCLSHYLQRHFLGLSRDKRRHLPETVKVDSPRIERRVDLPEKLEVEGVEGYQRALKVIEIELAFLYDIFFSGNAFLHYYQAKSASLWALASFTGICFVGVAAAIPGTIASTSNGGGSTSRFVDTTTADLVITFTILVSLALLQLLQLIRCWTSNWARVAVVCAYARSNKDKAPPPRWRAWWMRLKASVATSSNWFDKLLWQQEMGQFSILLQMTEGGERVIKRGASGLERVGDSPPISSALYQGCVGLVKVLGLDYIREVLWDLLGRDTNKGDAVSLNDEVKAYVIDFLGKMESKSLDGNWESFPHNPSIEEYLPYNNCNLGSEPEHEPGYGYARKLIAWCVVTGHCEANEGRRAGAHAEERDGRNRRVANALCNYCAYLMVSAPELLPGSVKETKGACKRYSRSSRRYFSKLRKRYEELAKDLLERSECWETLAAVWVRMLVYAAPYGSPEAHMRHLSQGGEFITHLWALLYHLGIRGWELPNNLHEVRTIDHAKTILTKFCPAGNKSTPANTSFLQDGIAVVACVERCYAFPSDFAKELVAASMLQRRVRFYQTTSPDVAELFHSGLAEKCPSLILLKKEEGDDKFTTLLYDGALRAYAIADFVSASMVRRRPDNDGHESEEEIISLEDDDKPYSYYRWMQ